MEQGKWRVWTAGAQNSHELAADRVQLVPPPGGSNCCSRQVAQLPQASFAEDAICRFAHYRVHAYDSACSVPQRTVRVGEVALLHEPLAIAGEQQVFRPA